MSSYYGGASPDARGGSSESYANQAPSQYAQPQNGPASTVAPGSIDAAEQYTTADSAYKRALIRYNQQRTGLLAQYGYKGTIDPSSGRMTNLGVDTSNAHGQLQELLGQQDNEDLAAQYAAEDRGLHGGLANQGESSLREGHMGQTGALGQALFGSLADINSQQQDSQSTLDQALWQLQQQAASSAVDGGQFTPAVPADDGARPVTVATSKTTKKAPAKKAAPVQISENGKGSHAALASKLVANAYTNGQKKRG